jgi:predicted glutamine amidotransferase
MCGLVGVAGTNLTQASNKIVKQLLYVDALRGPHSTGLATNNKQNEVTTYKRALTSGDFLQLDKAKSLLLCSTGNFMLGHNRFATQGAKNDDNSHPFTYGNVTLAHNGTLTDQTTLPDHLEFEVDSENIAYAMGLADKPQEVISKLVGAFALTWYNDHEQTFNIVRNSERPMWIAKAKNADHYYYASERFMLEMILSRNNVTYEINELPVAQLLTLDVSGAKTKVTMKQVSLAPKPKAKSSSHYNNGYDAGRYYPTKDKDDRLSDYKLSVGDIIEFYSKGLPDVLKSAHVGTLYGEATDHKNLKVKVFNQPNDSLAGYYKGVVTFLMRENNTPTLILRQPQLFEIVEGDIHNKGRMEPIAPRVATHKQMTTQ